MLCAGICEIVGLYVEGLVFCRVAVYVDYIVALLGTRTRISCGFGWTSVMGREQWTRSECWRK